MTRTRILDACCGSRMFWYDRDNKYLVKRRGWRRNMGCWMKTGKLILKQDLQSVLECCAHSERWFLSGIQSRYHLARL